jgi:hypothetical protein
MSKYAEESFLKCVHPMTLDDCQTILKDFCYDGELGQAFCLATMVKRDLRCHMLAKDIDREQWLELRSLNEWWTAAWLVLMTLTKDADRAYLMRPLTKKKRVRPFSFKSE